MLNWNQCQEVERSADKVSGAWVFCGTRVPVKALFENLEDGATIDQFLQKMKKLFTLCFVLCSILCMTHHASADDKTPKQVEKVYSDVKKLVAEFYPNAEVIEKESRLECRFKTRKFMVHLPLKTGEWQEARPMEGPDRSGMMCVISYQKGRWMGAAMVPQTFEYHYYASTLSCPYNKKLDMHLESHLYFPKNVKPEFLKRYSDLVNEFGAEKVEN